MKSEWKPAVSGNSTLYFTSNINGNGLAIYYSEFIEGRYSAPVPFDKDINEKYDAFCPCIAEDESFLVFASAVNLQFRTDLYITFKDEYGKWSEPVNLGREINSDRDDLFPQLSPDGNYLFFTSYRYIYPIYSEGRTYKEMLDIYNSPGNGKGGDIYWVSASIIEDLKNTGGRQ